MQIKATKKDLNSVIRWSSSRYNEKKKSDVVEQIIFLIEKGLDVKEEFVTGSYSERGHLGGWDYILEIKEGASTLTEKSVETKVYQIEKPKKNKYYTGAKKFRVIKGKYDWHKEIINQEFIVDLERVHDFYFYHIDSNGEKKWNAIDKNCVEILS